MKPRLKATRAARELIKAYEPFAAEAVRRGRRWVVGYGHTAAAKPGVAVSREDAELLLIYDVSRAEAAVKAAVGEDLPPAARDALISFAASIGVGAFKVSDVARLAAAGRHDDAARAMESWVRAEQDGRLVVSERLQQRRRAEKTLYLEGLSGAPAAAPPPAQDEPRLGSLVEVDIAFEYPAAAGSAAPDAACPDGEAPTEPAEPVAEPAAAALEPEAETAPVGEPDLEPAGEPAPEAADEPGPDRKAEQDAAIQAVMARMAGEIASSIGAPPAESEAETDAETDAAPGADAAAPDVPGEPAPDYAGVKLGFSFLSPAQVAVAPAASEPAPDPAENPAPVPAPAASAMPGPVYATVTVGPYTPPAADAPAEAAPPHPAEAPARAGGLSGESEGPDHGAAEEAHASGEDEAELDPAMVAGPEAPDAEPAAPMPSEGRGDWVYTANLAVGLGLTGYGAWELISNLDAYLAAGLDFSLIGPVAFGAGVLLSAASGWYVIGALRRRG